MYGDFVLQPRLKLSFNSNDGNVTSKSRLVSSRSESGSDGVARWRSASSAADVSMPCARCWSLHGAGPLKCVLVGAVSDCASTSHCTGSGGTAGLLYSKIGFKRCSPFLILGVRDLPFLFTKLDQFSPVKTVLKGCGGRSSSVPTLASGTFSLGPSS